MKGVGIVKGSWKCVLLGKEKGGQEDRVAHCVLLIRPVISSDPTDGLYESVGVAILLNTHLSVETNCIFLV